jgi:uncharacterized protein YvpB
MLVLKTSIYHKLTSVVVIVLLVNLFALGYTGISSAKAQEVLPTSAKITNMPVFPQQHNLSCEYSATRAAVARWGGTLSEVDFINYIGTNPNPHLAFRGNINGSFGGTMDYGIYAEPLALYLNSRGYYTKLLTGDIAEFKAEIVRGRPVVVWVPSGMSYSNVYKTSYEGLDFKLMPYEHAVTVYGYDENGIFVADPAFGSYDYYSWNSFIRAWGYLDKMAMSVWPAANGYEPGESIGVSPYFYRQWLNNGGLEIYGYPIAAPKELNGKLVQYFERARMEYDISGPRNQSIGLGLLGTEITANRTGELPFRIESKSSSTETVWVFEQTGHTLQGTFLDYWRNNGGLRVFGFPISEPFAETGKQVQYFERARFELTPSTTDQLRLGLLGYEYQVQSTQKVNMIKRIFMNEC